MNISTELAERSESEALYDFATATPAAREALGITLARTGGGTVISTRADETGFWSRASALGFDEPVTADLMAEVSAFFHAAGTPRAIVQIAPSVLPEDWEEIAAKVGLTAGSHWAKLACDVDVALARTVETDLRVGPVSAADGPEWASAMLTTFGMDGKYAPMVEASVERPGWTAFAAWLDDQIVTTGQVFVRGDTGQCFGGATKPEARRRGGQSAVLQARARVAKAQGCRWLVSETGAEQPGEHNSSLHNMYRLGFELLYERQNWIWSPSQD